MASTLLLRSFSISGSIDGFSVCRRTANQIPAAQGVSAMPISMAIALAPDKSRLRLLPQDLTSVNLIPAEFVGAWKDCPVFELPSSCARRAVAAISHSVLNSVPNS